MIRRSATAKKIFKLYELHKWFISSICDLQGHFVNYLWTIRLYYAKKLTCEASIWFCFNYFIAKILRWVEPHGKRSSAETLSRNWPQQTWLTFFSSERHNARTACAARVSHLIRESAKNRRGIKHEFLCQLVYIGTIRLK